MEGDQSDWDRGCRRPKTKYEIGTIPAELTTATTAAHSHFGPRIWLAGRRLRSINAATLRMPSATAAVMKQSAGALAQIAPLFPGGHDILHTPAGSLMARTLHRGSGPLSCERK
jgi:hypothetical protein